MNHGKGCYLIFMKLLFFLLLISKSGNQTVSAHVAITQ